jgi:hypothetical protein
MLSFKNDAMISTMSHMIFSVAWRESNILFPADGEHTIKFSDAGGVQDKNGIDYTRDYVIENFANGKTYGQIKLDMQSYATKNFFIETKMQYDTSDKPGCMSLSKVKESPSWFYTFLIPGVAMYTFTKQQLIDWHNNTNKKYIEKPAKYTTDKKGNKYRAVGLIINRDEFIKDVELTSGSKIDIVPWRNVLMSINMERYSVEGWEYSLNRLCIETCLVWANNYKHLENHYTQKDKSTFVMMLMDAFSNNGQESRFGYNEETGEYQSNFIENEMTFQNFAKILLTK